MDMSVRNADFLGSPYILVNYIHYNGGTKECLLKDI